MKKILLLFFTFLMFGCLNFKEETYKVDIVYNHQGVGFIELSPLKDRYEKGDEVILIPKAEYGYRFSDYDELSEEEKANNKIIINGDRVIYAKFTYNYFPELEGIENNGVYKELNIDYEKNDKFEVSLKIDNEDYDKSNIYNKEGKHTLKLSSKDKMTGIEHSKLYSFTIDKTPPEIIFFEEEFLFSATDLNGEVTVMINDEEIIKNGGLYTYKDKIINYKNDLVFKVIDISGNTTIVEKVYYAEKENPSYSIKSNYSDKLEIEVDNSKIISLFKLKIGDLEEKELKIDNSSSALQLLRTLTYENIPPGNYKIELKGYDNNGELIGFIEDEIEILDTKLAIKMTLDDFDIRNSDEYSSTYQNENKYYYVKEKDYEFTLMKFNFSEYEDDDWYTEAPEYENRNNNYSDVEFFFYHSFTEEFAKDLINTKIYLNEVEINEGNIYTNYEKIKVLIRYEDFKNGENIIKLELEYEATTVYKEFKVFQVESFIKFSNEGIEVNLSDENYRDQFRVNVDREVKNNNFIVLDKNKSLYNVNSIRIFSHNYYYLKGQINFYLVNKKKTLSPKVDVYKTSWGRWTRDVYSYGIFDVVLESSKDNIEWINHDESPYRRELQSLYFRYRNKFDVVSESVFSEVKEEWKND